MVPVPAFIFFHFAGFLGKIGKIVTPIFVVLFLSISAGSMLFGTHAARAMRMASFLEKSL